MKIRLHFLLAMLVGSLFINSCGEEEPPTTSVNEEMYPLSIPSHFPTPIIPNDNLLTKKKVQLGRMLFYEKGLSEDNLVSCGSCHKQALAFGSDKRQDIKVNHGMTDRHTSVLFNLAFTTHFFWDGRTKSLEETCLDALVNEQGFNANFVSSKLYSKHNYKELFKDVFDTDQINDQMVAKAIASFIRTMISGNSKIDKGISEGNVTKYLNELEKEGKIIFEDEEGDCFHCHGDVVGNPLMTDNEFHNNALDAFTFSNPPKDIGLMKPTGNQNNMAKFKTPPIRNVSYSAPYMHDGRFKTIDEVLNHYSSGLKESPTVDPNMKKLSQGGVQLMPDRIAKLKAFILAFDDEEFIRDTAFSDPF